MITPKMPLNSFTSDFELSKIVANQPALKSIFEFQGAIKEKERFSDNLYNFFIKLLKSYSNLLIINGKKL